MAHALLSIERLFDRDFEQWYGWPNDLGAALRQVGGFPKSLADVRGARLPHAVLTNGLARAFALTHTGAPYHGMGHPEDVTASFEQVLSAYLEHAQLDSSEPLVHWWELALLQGAMLGAAAHDAKHCAATFFADAPAHRVPSGSEHLTVEEYSARECDKIARDIGMSPHARAAAVDVVRATTHGQRSERGRAMGLGRIRVRGILGLMARAADVRPALTEPARLRDELALAFGEHPAFPRPRTPEEIVARHRRYLEDEVTGRYDALDEAAGFALTAKIGWRDELAAAQRSVARLGPVADAVLGAELLRYDNPFGDPDLAAIPPYLTLSECAVLVTDMPKSVAARTGLNAPAQERFIHGHYPRLIAASRAFGAVPYEQTGDGLMFSCRPQPAALCAMALSLADPQHPVRVGAAFGEVAFDGRDCFGTTVSLAARLCRHAAAGRPVITGDLLSRSELPPGTAVVARDVGPFDGIPPFGAVELQPLR